MGKHISLISGFLTGTLMKAKVIQGITVKP